MWSSLYDAIVLHALNMKLSRTSFCFMVFVKYDAIMYEKQW